MASPGPAARGLSAAELAAVVGELQVWLGAVVLDAAPLSTAPGADDLLLVLQAPATEQKKAFLHVAPGSTRARVTLTARRFGSDAMPRSPARDLLQRHLVDATLRHVGQSEGERRCTFGFATAQGDRRLVVELFGARGFWALLDAEGRLVVMSRAIETAVRTLKLGEPYAPPPAQGPARADGESRFAVPVLAAIDAHFSGLDSHAEAVHEHDVLLRSAERALQKAKAKVGGLCQQLADVGRSQTLREQADLMLAYAHTVRRGAAQMTVPDPLRDGEVRTFELDPSQPVVAQGQALYEKARRLDDGRAMAEQRLAAAEAVAATLQPIADALGAPPADASDRDAELVALRRQLQQLGALPKAQSAAAATTKKPMRDEAAGENFRRFVSAEGYPIWVGRNNEQNDRLTMRVANGNDLWLHVGGGRAGSHVVVRLPKQKTASLETLLDAATLAVHFSKARGEPRIDVVYTFKKHVKKPKGLPAGAVVPAQTKTITVHHDESRLRRLLDSSGED